MYKHTEELEEITDQEADEKDRYFSVRKGTIRIIVILWRK